MADSASEVSTGLALFSEQVTSARRKVGRFQKDLASALGFNNQVLSRKMNGSSQNYLTAIEVKQIIKILAEWDAITTQAEAIHLLDLMQLRQESFSINEWATPPLNRLAPVPSTTQPSLRLVGRAERGFPRPPLPVPLTSLIGRETMLIQANDLLKQPSVRLLSLLGPGGVGKTRVGLAIAEAFAHEFANGVVFVSLGSLADASLVLSAIVQALGLTGLQAGLPGRDPSSYEQLLKSFLREQSLLLLLDNFEHVLGAAHHLNSLLEHAPHLKILVTSRSALSLYGEQQFIVSPLPLVDTPQESLDMADLAQVPAIQLFTERARATNPRFALTPQNALAITQLCQHLDGLPLAIELAAVRCRLLSPQAILQRLFPDTRDSSAKHPLTFLRQQTRDVPDRQKTLWGTLDWSYQQLDINTQQLFSLLGIFRGIWTLEAVQSIASHALHISDEAILEELTELVDHSLVLSLFSGDAVEDQPDSTHFQLLETIREYALAHLQEHEQYQQVQEQFAQYYLSLVESSVPVLNSQKWQQGLRKLVMEQDNIRQTLQWIFEEGKAEEAIRLCSDLSTFWEMQSRFQEAHSWIDRALTQIQLVSIALQARLLLAASRLAGWEMAYERSRMLASRALALYEQDEDQHGRVLALFQIGDAWYMQGDGERARQYFETCLPLQRTLGNWWAYGLTLSRLGGLAFLQGQLTTAHRLLTEAEPLLFEYRGSWGLTTLLSHLGIVAILQGRLEDAFTVLKEGVSLSYNSGQLFNLAMNLIVLGCAFGSAGSSERAAQICSAGEALMSRIGSIIPASYQQLYHTVLDRSKMNIPEHVWNRWWAIGSSLSETQAVALALMEEQEEM